MHALAPASRALVQVASSFFSSARGSAVNISFASPTARDGFVGARTVYARRALSVHGTLVAVFGVVRRLRVRRVLLRHGRLRRLGAVGILTVTCAGMKRWSLGGRGLRARRLRFVVLGRLRLVVT